MRVAVPRETDAGEPRVAATPETVKKLKSFGADVAVARGAGIASGIPDSRIRSGGRTDRRRRHQRCRHRAQGAPAGAGRARRLQERRARRRHHGSYGNEAALKQMADAGVVAFAMELMPRITRAQSMDVLSSQANLAGYRAVIDAPKNTAARCR